MRLSEKEIYQACSKSIRSRSTRSAAGNKGTTLWGGREHAPVALRMRPSPAPMPGGLEMSPAPPAVRPTPAVPASLRKPSALGLYESRFSVCGDRTRRFISLRFSADGSRCAAAIAAPRRPVPACARACPRAGRIGEMAASVRDSCFPLEIATARPGAAAGGTHNGNEAGAADRACRRSPATVPTIDEARLRPGGHRRRRLVAQRQAKL